MIFYGKQPAGVFCLSERPDKCYDEITDGKWRSDGKYCTVHRSAVEAQFRGTGLSEYIFRFAEELAREKGAAAVRVDTHRKNEAMKKLLHKCGYTYRGNVLVYCEPGHDPRRQAFEKGLRVESGVNAAVQGTA